MRWQLHGFLYLSEVDADSAPPRLVPTTAVDPSSAYPDPALPHEAPALYAAEQSVPGPRGSFLAYRADVWHRGANLFKPGSARFVLAVGYKVADCAWINHHDHALARHAPNLFMQRFVTNSTPEELSLLGIPEPGHPFWSPTRVEAFSRKYAGLDVTPWRAALSQE